LNQAGQATKLKDMWKITSIQPFWRHPSLPWNIKTCVNHERRSSFSTSFPITSERTPYSWETKSNKRKDQEYFQNQEEEFLFDLNPKYSWR